MREDKSLVSAQMLDSIHHYDTLSAVIIAVIRYCWPY